MYDNDPDSNNVSVLKARLLERETTIAKLSTYLAERSSRIILLANEIDQLTKKIENRDKELAKLKNSVVDIITSLLTLEDITSLFQDMSHGQKERNLVYRPGSLQEQTHSGK
jgi:hypothetical protein